MLKKLFGSLLGGSNEPAQQNHAPNFEERRKATRRKCELSVEANHARRSFQAVVVDLSAGGAQVICPANLKVKINSPIKLTYYDGSDAYKIQTIECSTIWKRVSADGTTQSVGVKFVDQKSMGKSWVKPIMQEIGFRPNNIREQRKMCRVGCYLKASVKLPGFQGVVCKVKNIGLGGLLLELPKPLRAGATVTVVTAGDDNLPANSYDGIVRHQQHPDPSAPFAHGLSFTGLTEEQKTDIQSFMIGQRKLGDKATLTWEEEIAREAELAAAGETSEEDAAEQAAYEAEKARILAAALAGELDDDEEEEEEDETEAAEGDGVDESEETTE